jgi:hypothetical protein
MDAASSTIHLNLMLTPPVIAAVCHDNGAVCYPGPFPAPAFFKLFRALAV